jgi:hypothetical protein
VSRNLIDANKDGIRVDVSPLRERSESPSRYEGDDKKKLSA